jgi:hypothetical protein
MVSFSGAASSSEAARDASKYKRALIVTGVTAAVLFVIVVIQFVILYVKVFNVATDLQLSHGECK